MYIELIVLDFFTGKSLEKEFGNLKNYKNSLQPRKYKYLNTNAIYKSINLIFNSFSIRESLYLLTRVVLVILFFNVK